MKRAFKYFPLGATNVAQPAFGTTLGAAVIPSSVPSLIAVQDSSLFRPNDTALLDIQGANEESVQIMAVPDGTHVQVKSIQFAHANGVFFRLAQVISTIYIQAKDGNVGPLFIGVSPASKTDGTLILKKIVQAAANSQPLDFSDSFTSGAGHNPFNSAEYWVVGTLNDQFLPSLGLV